MATIKNKEEIQEKMEKAQSVTKALNEEFNRIAQIMKTAHVNKEAKCGLLILGCCSGPKQADNICAFIGSRSMTVKGFIKIAGSKEGDDLREFLQQVELVGECMSEDRMKPDEDAAPSAEAEA